MPTRKSVVAVLTACPARRPGPWNQAYLFDTLRPGEIQEEGLQPGDLIFWAGEYHDTERTPFKHNMVHVEVFVGGDSGEATIGSRPANKLDPAAFQGVAMQESFRSYDATAVSTHSHRLFFRSIEGWLRGVCVSHCKECGWGELRPNAGRAAACSGGAPTSTVAVKPA